MTRPTLAILALAAASLGPQMALGTDSQLSWSDRARLERDKIVITDREYAQVFCPYVEPDMPVFITSDSIVNAYHVLLEETVRRIEQGRTAELASLLKRLWDRLDQAAVAVKGDEKLTGRAHTRAKIVVGVALMLCGQPCPADGEFPPAVSSTVAKIEAAQGVGLFPWGREVDYSRYRPRGFYADQETLRQYFRTVSWLQSVPFQIDEDDELLAVLMLAQGLEPKDEACLASFRELLGDRDDWDLANVAKELPQPWALDLTAGDLAALRQRLHDRAARTGHEAMINDQLVEMPLGLNARIISAYRTPDAILFQKTTMPGGPTPDALRVAAALGSSYAAETMQAQGQANILATVEREKDLFRNKNMYCDYLHCLSTLFDAPDRRCPAFMSNRPWQAKSCQTVMAGWAQLRHTYILQAKQTTMYFFAMDRTYPAGFVEPNPVFFDRLRSHAKQMAALMTRTPMADAKALRRFDAQTTVGELLKRLEAVNASGLKPEELAVFRIQQLSPPAMNDLVSGLKSDRWRASLDKAIDAAKAAQRELAQDDANPTQWQQSGPDWAAEPMQKYWRDLATLAGRLHALAEKQLTGVPFTEDETLFILDYGKHLAPLMFHLGAATEVPRDDVPKIADVVHNPNTNEYLEVGVGRPRLLYVLYPTADGEVLCRGAVLPYFEFCSSKRLDDHQWHAMLASGEAPAQPDWLSPATGVSSLRQKLARGIFAGVVAFGVVAAAWAGYRILVRRRKATAPAIAQP